MEEYRQLAEKCRQTARTASAENERADAQGSDGGVRKELAAAMSALRGKAGAASASAKPSSTPFVETSYGEFALSD